MGDNNRTANATRWTRGEVFELLALIVGLPAAIAAVMVISTVWKRHRRRRRGELSTFVVSFSMNPRFCGL